MCRSSAETDWFLEYHAFPLPESAVIACCFNPFSDIKSFMCMSILNFFMNDVACIQLKHY